MWRREDGRIEWRSDSTKLSVEAHRGLTNICLGSAEAWLPQLLGVEIVSAHDLGICPLFQTGEEPEVIVRQDTVFVSYRPTHSRPVECQARWRIGEERVYDLEISALTPGKWKGLSVRTVSEFGDGHIRQLGDFPLLIVHQPDGQGVSYVEMCHPHDGIGVEIEGRKIHFRLFGHDLEKGVILRGRVRGLIIPREGDLTTAQRAFDRFVREPPRLSV